MTNEVLQQFAQIVSDILDTKLKTELQPIRDDIREMKSEMAVIKADIEGMKSEMAVMKADIEEMKSEMAVMKADIENLKADIENLKAEIAVVKVDIQKLKADVDALNAGFEELQCKVASIGLHVENETDKYVRIVAENHIELSRKLDRAIPAVDRQKVYKKGFAFSFLPKLYYNLHISEK